MAAGAEQLELIELGPRTADVLDEVWKASRYRSDESLVFGHPALGTPVDRRSCPATTCGLR